MTLAVSIWVFLKRKYRALLPRFFELCAQAKPLFGFDIDADPYNEIIYASRRFEGSGKLMIFMLDTSLKLLDHLDAQDLQKEMEELGKKHNKFGVKPEYFPIMQTAIFDMMAEMIGEDFNDDAKKGWVEVYAALSGEMIAAMKKEAGITTKKNIEEVSIGKIYSTIATWESLSEIADFEEKAGVILFVK